jgi:hypothetical protein
MERSKMINPQEIYEKKKSSPIDRNERMTAIAGAVVFVFIIAELLITANLHGLLTEHIFVGVLLSGPLVVKMFSTGYRFFRYYTKSSDFVRKGPPNIILRLLAPFLVLTTFLVFISGFGLTFGHDDRLFGKIHSVSVALWIPLTAVHAYAYIRKVPGLIASDWKTQSKYQVSGRKWRLGINIAGLMAGAIAAIVMLPLYASGWGHLGFHLPGPLSLGIAAAIIAVLVAIPLLRLTKKAKRL